MTTTSELSPSTRPAPMVTGLSHIGLTVRDIVASEAWYTRVLGFVRAFVEPHGTGNGYAVMLHLRNRDTVLYSLVFAPESGPDGTWVEVRNGQVSCGADDLSRPAEEVLRTMPAVNPKNRPESKMIYLIGFQQHDPDRVRDVTAAGLEGHTSDTMDGSIYELLSRGQYGGSLIHSPNVYDFPVSLHIARVLGGDAVWVHNRKPVNFQETWLDDRANMIRLPGIVACGTSPQTLDTLCTLARDWNPLRYPQ